MKKPNFFIVGAPKCGTTSLSVYLREHPNVFMCTPKEPHYFSTDLPKYRLVTSEKDYLNLFSSATNIHHAVGEASATYLYSKTAIPAIRQFNPSAKIIVMVRNPIELVYSMHSTLFYGRDEEVTEFTNAWELNKRRKSGTDIPKKCRDIKMLYYDEIAKFGEQLERLLCIFPQEQIIIVFTEDFFENTFKVYQEILSFLRLPKDYRGDFPILNRNRTHKIGWLANFTQRPPKKLVDIAFRLKRSLGVERLGVLRAIRNANVTTGSRKNMNYDVKQKLVNEYHNDILKLSQLTGRDLSHWINVI